MKGKPATQTGDLNSASQNLKTLVEISISSKFRQACFVSKTLFRSVAR